MASITRPVVSEKAFALAEDGRYVFLVPTSSNKTEIRRLVEREFQVRVRSVNSLIIKGRPRRYGKVIGQTKDYKKMVVTLAPGEKITMFEAEAKDKKKEAGRGKQEEEKK